MTDTDDMCYNSSVSESDVDEGCSDMKEQLCWSCKKATGRCSWSRNFTPVEGWDADAVRLNVSKKYENVGSFFVKGCPEYEPESVCERCVNLPMGCDDAVSWRDKCPFATGGPLSLSICVRCNNKYERELIARKRVV